MPPVAGAPGIQFAPSHVNTSLTSKPTVVSTSLKSLIDSELIFCNAESARAPCAAVARPASLAVPSRHTEPL